MTPELQQEVREFLDTFIRRHRLMQTWEFSETTPMYLCKECRVEYEMVHLIEQREPEHDPECCVPQAMVLLKRMGA